MTKADRQKVFEKYGGRCSYCGCELSKGWHLDHKEPVQRNYEYVVVKPKLLENGNYSHYGTRYKRVCTGMVSPHLDTVENAMPSCAKCNINKHGDTIEQFRSNIARYLESLNERIVQYQMVKKYGLITETNIEVKFYFEQF